MTRRWMQVMLAVGLAAGLTAAALWAPAALAAGETRTSTGDVSFALTPRGMVDGRFQVEVSVDTHSGSLSALSLQERTVLRAGGMEWRPVQPVRLGGHHARGALVFDLAQAPTAFEIVIEAPRGDGALTFRWP